MSLNNGEWVTIIPPSDLAGGSQFDFIPQRAIVRSDPSADYISQNKVQHVASFVQKVGWREGIMARIGEVQIPSRAVKIEVSKIPGRFTQITLYPEYSEELLELVSSFEPEAKQLLELALQNSQKVALTMYQNQLAVSTFSNDITDPNWYETKSMSFQDDSEQTGVSIRKMGATQVIEKHLLTLNSEQYSYVLVTGVRIFGSIDKRLENELLNLPTSKYNWSTLSEIAQPFIEIRRIDKLGNVEVY